jgi:hypothetical protein
LNKHEERNDMGNKELAWPVVKLFFYDKRMTDWCQQVGLEKDKDYYINTVVEDLNRMLKLKTHLFYFKNEKYATLFALSFSHVLI